jgi:uncharacterized membrane protein
MEGSVPDIPNDAPLGTSRKSDEKNAIAEAAGFKNASLIARTVTIDRPRDEIYKFWRDFTNLAAFLENIERVDVRDDRFSHWVLKGPADKSVEWDSEIIEDVDGEVIAWRSVGDADVKNIGRVEFRDAPPGRGTEVSAIIAYEAPGGELGKLIAKLFGTDPNIAAFHDLRRLKQLLEAGEISTSKPPYAAPRAS